MCGRGGVRGGGGEVSVWGGGVGGVCWWGEYGCVVGRG